MHIGPYKIQWLWLTEMDTFKGGFGSTANRTCWIRNGAGTGWC